MNDKNIKKIKIEFIEDDEYKQLYNMTKAELIEIIKECDRQYMQLKEGK